MISTLCRRATAASARRRSSLKTTVVGLCRLGTRKTAPGPEARESRFKRIRPHALPIERQAAQIEAERSAQRTDALIGDRIRQHDVAALRQRAQDAGEAKIGRAA